MHSSREYPYPPKKELKFPGGGWGGGSVRPKNIKKCMEFNWNWRGGGGVDIFWNYTMYE